MNCCYSCVLEPLLRLVLFHPFPQRPSKPCQVAFGPEPVSHHFASPQQVHMTETVPPSQTSCTHTWLYLVLVLWPIFTRRATIPLLTNRLTIWKAWLHIQIQSCISVRSMWYLHDAGLYWTLFKRLKWKNTVVMIYIRPFDHFLKALSALQVLLLTLWVV